MAISPDTIQGALDRIKQRKDLAARYEPKSVLATQKSYKDTQDYTDFGPQELDTQLIEDPLRQQLQDTVLDADNEATATSIVEARNRHNYKAYQDAKRAMNEAKRNQVKLNPTTPGIPGVPNSNGPVANGSIPATPGSSYYTKTPGWLNINSGLTTFNVGGRSYTVNKSAAPRFQGFLTDLLKMGYKIKTAGSYADRNQANGSGQKSLHAYGLAIDLNAFGAGNSFNPGNKGVHSTNLPKGISALAAKYGLVWGGDWRNSKDYMHFSVPYQGRL